MIKEINEYNGVLKQISSNPREPNGQKNKGSKDNEETQYQHGYQLLIF